MKKLLSVMLVMLMLLSLVGCSSSKSMIVEAVFEPFENIDVTAVQLDAVKTVIEDRLAPYEISNCTVNADYDNDQVIVQFPPTNDINPAELVKELSAAGNLTFRNPDGEIVMDGSCIESAVASVLNASDSGSEYVVTIRFTDEGAALFAQITEEYINQQISIYIDDTLLSNPTVYAPITEGSAQISGGFTAEEATKLANRINSGAMPFEISGSYVIK